jgi:Ca-activated chloride channel family protein
MVYVEGVRSCVRAVVAVCLLAAGSGACRTHANDAPDPERRAFGGSGTRARGEEGSMGNPTPSALGRTLAAPASPPLANGPSPSRASGVAGAPAAQEATLDEKSAASFGMVGLIGGSGVIAARSMAAPPALARDTAAVAETPHLNPNARYATTYRPGGAALAAFDAAVARGQIPPPFKDLVADFGARYAPALARPAEGALTIAVDTERAAVGPEGGPVNLRVALVSSDAMPTRAPLSVHIVLDISGSMSGQAIEDAKHAAEATVAKLEPTDDFSMVTFSNSAQVLVGDGPIGARRSQVLARIEEVRAGGGTNMSSGLDLGYAQAHAASVSDDAVRVLLLLSDGHANAGDTDPGRLAERANRAFQDGIQTSAFGLGMDFDAGLMSRIADRGAGGYYYLADSSQIAPALAREIDARLRPVATAIEMRVRLRPDVSATRVFGSRELTEAEAAAVRAQEVAVDRGEKKHGIAPDREMDAAGGMRFFIPAFARADRHATLMTLQLPPGAGQRCVASVEVRYKDRLTKKNATRELPVRLRWAASDAESAATANAGVERMSQAFEAGETILAAAEAVDRGDRPMARAALDERAQVLRRASEALAEPMLAEDGARLARLASAVGGAGQMGDPLALVVMLRGSGYGYF